MYSNYVLNFKESTAILNASTKKSLETYRRHHVYVFLKYAMTDRRSKKDSKLLVDPQNHWVPIAIEFL